MLQTGFRSRVDTTRAVVEQTLDINSPTRWLIALSITVGLTLLLVMLQRGLGRYLGRPSKRTHTPLDDLLASLVRRTQFFFLLVVSLSVASTVLMLNSQARSGIKLLTGLALLFQIAIWANAFIAFALAHYAARRTAQEGPASAATLSAVSYAARVVVWFLVVIIALGSLGINITVLVAGVSLSGIAVAFALQNVLSDLFGALSILVDKPFVVGDAIAVDAYSGAVEHIGLKTTRVRADGGEQIIFSNSELLKSRIRNYARMPERRIVFPTRVAGDTPAATAARIPAMLQQIVEAQATAQFRRSHLKGVGDTWLEFETLYALENTSYNVFMDTQQAIALGVLRRFDSEGIQLAAQVETAVKREIARNKGTTGVAAGQTQPRQD